MTFHSDIASARSVIESTFNYTATIKRRGETIAGEPKKNEKPELIGTSPCWLDENITPTEQDNKRLLSACIFLPLGTDVQTNDVIVVDKLEGDTVEYNITSKPIILPTHIEIEVGGVIRG